MPAFVSTTRNLIDLRFRPEMPFSDETPRSLLEAHQVNSMVSHELGATESGETRGQT